MRRPGSSNPLAEALDLHRRGKLNPARKLYRDIIVREPRNLDALELYGQVCCELGDHGEAARVLERAVAARPKSFTSVVNLGNALRLLGRLPDAEARFRAAVELRPMDPHPHHGLGVALLMQRRPEEAAASFATVTRFDPKHADAWMNLGQALAILGRERESAQAFDKAVALEPDKADTYREFGRSLLFLGLVREAIEVLERAVALDPKSTESIGLLGGALRVLGRLDEAISVLERALAIEREPADAVVQVLAARRSSVDWRDHDRLQRLLDRVPEGGYVTNTFVLWLKDDPVAQQKAARGTANLFDVPSPRPPVRRGAGPIRVAYISFDVREHPVAHAIVGPIEAHDRGRVEAHVIGLNPVDDSAIARRLRAGAHTFHDASGKEPAVILELVRRLDLDILVDLGGLTEGNARSALTRRPAPVQVSFLGWPGTMGASWIDYLVADATVVPPGCEAWFDEKLVRLPGSYLPSSQGRADPGPASRAEEGLPERGPVLASFTTIDKISPDLLDSWARILARVPDAVLWLARATPLATRNLAREAAARGIAPGRLLHARFVESREHHLARHRLADLFLDTFPYGAHSTASDALWAGLPVITRAGRSFPSRVAASLLHTLGLDELIVATEAEYEALAVRLASDGDARARLRQRLDGLRKTSPHYEPRVFAGHLESAYARMLEIARSGGGPQAFDITA